MQILEYFKTPIWVEHKPEFITSINKASNQYIKDAKNKKRSGLNNMETLEDLTIQHLY